MLLLISTKSGKWPIWPEKMSLRWEITNFHISLLHVYFYFYFYKRYIYIYILWTSNFLNIIFFNPNKRILKPSTFPFPQSNTHERKLKYFISPTFLFSYFFIYQPNRHLFTFPLVKNLLCHLPPIISPLKPLVVLISLYYVPIQRLCLIVEPTCIPWLCHFYSKGYYCLDHLPIVFTPHGISSLIRNLFISSLFLSHPLLLCSRFHFINVFGYLTIEMKFFDQSHLATSYY